MGTMYFVSVMGKLNNRVVSNSITERVILGQTLEETLGGNHEAIFGNSIQRRCKLLEMKVYWESLKDGEGLGKAGVEQEEERRRKIYAK